MREEGNSSGSAMDTTTTTVASSTTPDEATYIAQHLGAQHLPLTTIIPISVVYSIIFIVGVLGNVSTICVILKNKYMHTPTNVYLANLALSDLLTHLVAMPFELYWLWRQYPWVFGEAICDAKMLTTETVTYSSILTIVAFTVERYMAICRPLTVPFRRLSKMSRATWALVAIWISSVLFSLPWLYYNKVNYLTNDYTGEEMPASAWCAVPWNENAKAPLYFMICSTFVAFVIPFSLVTVLYFRIGVAMKKSSALQRCCAAQAGTLPPGQQQQPNSSAECETEMSYNKGRQAVVRMLVAVVLVFFICWTPFHSQRLMFVIVTLQGKWNHANSQTHHILFLASGVGYYLSSSINPLLYSVMSKRFRRGFQDMFRRSHSHSNNFPAAGSAAVNAAAMAATVPRVHVTRYGAREVARFQLPMAPRHVIPPKHKKDILTKAFRFHKNNDDHLEHSKVKREARSVGSENSSFYKCTSSAAQISNSRSPRLVVSWKRPNERPTTNLGFPDSSFDRSFVELGYNIHDTCCSQTIFPKCQVKTKKLSKKLKRQKKAESDDLSQEFPSDLYESRKLKSEGDTPDGLIIDEDSSSSSNIIQRLKKWK